MKLAVSLAERFNGEIINGDSVQMYDGLPIATNKMPVEERKSIPHHLLGCIPLTDKPWNVCIFRKNAVKVIDEIRSRGKLPILVGGTHFYTTALLFRTWISEEHLQTPVTKKDWESTWPILGASAEEMLEKLQMVDPIMAARWHPKDHRKIKRSLEIYLTTGEKASKIYERNWEKTFSTGSEPLATLESGISSEESQIVETVEESPMRFDTLIFWAHVDSNVLQPRLDERVDAMVSRGLITEAQSMFARFQELESAGHVIDQSAGIWAAIGYKEYLPFLHATRAANVDIKRLEELKQEGVDRTKIETRQYSKNQIRWIKNELLRALEQERLEKMLFLLDATDLAKRSCNVDNFAYDITGKFLRGDPLPSPKSISPTAEQMLVSKKKVNIHVRHCDICAQTVMSNQWTPHVNSRQHRSALKPKIDWRKLYPRKRDDNKPQNPGDNDTTCNNLPSESP